jgi:hypothetical protein
MLTSKVVISLKNVYPKSYNPVMFEIKNVKLQISNFLPLFADNVFM